MATRPAISRRAFVVGSAAGLAFGFGVPGRLGRALARAGFSPNIWVTIHPDDTITIVAPAAEMGQGVMTSMPMLVAEELDADWAKVKIVQAPSDRAYGNPGFGGLQVTGASRTTPGYFMLLRQAGAQARRVLLDAVAQHWGVPVAELETEPNVVLHRPSGRRISYGEIARFAQAPATLPTITPADLKRPDQFRLIGRNLPRVELPDKVTGRAIYGIDVEVPDMLVASVLRAPVYGAPPERVDDSAARAVPGVTHVVMLPWGVGVVGHGFEAVQKGKAALRVTWKPGTPAERYSTDEAIGEYAAIAATLSRRGLVIHEAGDVAAAMRRAVRTLAAVYVTDHVYHATMEPMNATARVRPDGGVEIWAPTQAPSRNQLAVAAALGIAPAQVTVHTTLLGGGFGRRLENDFVLDAVLLARAVGRPVKVIWSREDDVRNDKYRPLTAQFLEAGLDAAGNLAAWRHRIVAASIYARFNPPAMAQLKGRDLPVIQGHMLTYAVANQLHEYLREDRGVDVGPWRSVGVGYTKFAIESFIDELARAQRIDPVQWRLRLLAHHARAARVVRRAAEMADWGRRRRGRGLGLAFSEEWNTYVAAVAEVSVERATGALRVHRVWCAVDPGLAIHPDTIVAQIESGVNFGISHVLGERITIQRGVVQQSNFHDYPVLRMADAPEISVEVLSSDHPPGGIGEVGLPPMGGAIGNAVAALTGARVRALPMTPERVLAALRA